MSLNQSSSLVQRAIDLNYANKKRGRSIKWILVNVVVLLIFTYDLSCKCPGYTSIFHYAELVVTGVMAANLVHHLLQLLPRRCSPVPLSRAQQKLLGLPDSQLDSSFILSDEVSGDLGVKTPEHEPTGSWWDSELSLSPRSSPRSPPSPPSPSSSPTLYHDVTKDSFIADRKSLSEYLKQYEERNSGELMYTGGESAWGLGGASGAGTYQTAAVESGREAGDEEGAAAGWPQVCWQLELDPRRLTQFNLNLRLWIHVTILARLVREIERADEALARAGSAPPGALRDGLVPAERLRASARACPDLAPLLPFLEPFSDQRYLMRRIRELASGECMSAYRWNGGGASWDESKPTDAELVLQLVAAYLDAQSGGALPGRAFSTEYLSSGPVPRRAPGALGVHRLTTRPPHYALLVGEQRVELPRGRNNLLHTLLCLIAAAARRSPPTLARLHLGPAGLNMLWIIGR